MNHSPTAHFVVASSLEADISAGSSLSSTTSGPMNGTPIEVEAADYLTDNLIGNSQVMRAVRADIRNIARFRNTDVLITGESGTGKEIVARCIHELSGRSKEKFLAVNCATLTSELALSELFGHAKGAFTSALRNHTGLFEVADKGTIFLDEFHSLDPRVQAQLLRVLECKTYSPVGSSEAKTTNARIIFATNENLMELVEDDKLRHDLYQRLPSVRV